MSQVRMYSRAVLVNTRRCVTNRVIPKRAILHLLTVRRNSSYIPICDTFQSYEAFVDRHIGPSKQDVQRMLDYLNRKVCYIIKLHSYYLDLSVTLLRNDGSMAKCITSQFNVQVYLGLVPSSYPFDLSLSGYIYIIIKIFHVTSDTLEENKVPFLSKKCEILLVGVFDIF